MLVYLLTRMSKRSSCTWQRKVHFFSSLFGRKKHDEQQTETQTTDESLAAVEQEQLAEKEPSAETEPLAEQEPSAQEQEPSAQEQEPSAQEQEPSEANKEPAAVDLPSAADDAATAMQESAATAKRPEKKSWWQRLREGLQKTSNSLGSGLASLFVGKKIDDELFEDLETHLLMADVGVATTSKIIEDLTEHASRQELKDADLLYTQIKGRHGGVTRAGLSPSDH